MDTEAELQAEKVDMVVFGTIYTAEEENDGMAEAFAVKDGKYIYLLRVQSVRISFCSGISFVTIHKPNDLRQSLYRISGSIGHLKWIDCHDRFPVSQ